MPKNTPVDEERFVELYTDTANTKFDIAEALGIHPATVRAVALRLGLPLRPLTPPRRADTERFRQMWNDGVPSDEIAERLSISPETIRGIRHRLGLPIRPRRAMVNDPYLGEQVAAKIAENKSRPQIAEELGVTVDTVSHIRRRLGLPRFPVHAPENPPLGAAEPKYDRDLVRQMIEESMSNRKIAEAIGSTKRTVERIRKELGLGLPPTPRYPPEVKQRALELLQEGASYREVARTLGISHHRVRKWFPGMGWTQKQSAEYRHLKKKMDELDGKMRTGLDWV